MSLNLNRCDEGEPVLIKNVTTGILVECTAKAVGKLFLYANMGSQRQKFFKASGKSFDGDYQVLTFGASSIEDFRKKNTLDNPDTEGDRSRLEIPKPDSEEGSLSQTAELLGRRVTLHWANKDFDGAIRILTAAKREHETRESDLKAAAKCNGIGIPLTLLGLSLKTTNAVERAGCRTVFDLCMKDGGSLMLGAGLGPVSYDEIRLKLDEYGFDHRMEKLQVRKAS